jgi:hypothetical protein
MNRPAFLAASAALLLPAAASAAEATATVGASVIGSEISIQKQRDYNLGTIAKPSIGTYVVTLASGGARSGSGGSGGQVIGGSGTTALFDVSGQENRDFTISTPSTVTLTTGGGGANREVAFTPSHAAAANLGPGTAGYAVKQIELTGSLSVPFDSVEGAYSGSVPVTVEYQ